MHERQDLDTVLTSTHQCSQHQPVLTDTALWLHTFCWPSLSLDTGSVFLWKRVSTPQMSLSSESRNEASDSGISPASNITPRLSLRAGLEVQGCHLHGLPLSSSPGETGLSWTPPLHLTLSQQHEWAEWGIRWLDPLYLWTREGAREHVCIFTSIIPSTSPPTWVWLLAPEQLFWFWWWPLCSLF